MKNLILCSLVGALAILLTNGPLVAQAMDSGMTGYEGYGRYDMGPGMMHYGGTRNYGEGPGMTGQGYENEPHYYRNQKIPDKRSAARILGNYLNSKNDSNLKLGKIKDRGSVFEADLLTKDNSLVDKLIVDKNTGRMRSAY